LHQINYVQSDANVLYKHVLPACVRKRLKHIATN
jgi:hypothetical protein